MGVFGFQFSVFSFRFSVFGFRFDGLGEAGEHFRDCFQFGYERVHLLSRQDTDLSGDVALGPKFGGGTAGDGQKPDEILAASLRALGDVRGNRNRSTLHLVAKRELSRLAKVPIHLHRQLAGPLPNLQLLKRPIHPFPPTEH
jgi:hypothetical protein